MNNSHVLRVAQRGATLLVALIFLLVMTIAGISAMRFATFEEHMASNTEVSNEMFQQAQSEIQAHLLNFNSNYEEFEALDNAKNAPTDTGDPEADPMLKSLPTDVDVKQPIELSVISPANIDANNTLRYIKPVVCPGGTIGVFECDAFEMQITAFIGTAKSWQTQGITFEGN